jgi:uncharacterized protein (DUF58 family)
VQLVVENQTAFPIPWLLIEDLLPRRALDPRFPGLKVRGRRIRLIWLGPRGRLVHTYRLACLRRGYYQIGPAVLETGDLFGLHRRFRVGAAPHFLLVYPRVVALTGYEIASRRPVGEVRLSHRLYEDPTRIAGVRRYELGDPLNRVHWKATARTGELHSKVHEPSTLAGATLLLDFHDAGYPPRTEPHRSDLAITAVVSLTQALCELGEQVGMMTNARDAADRIRTEGWEAAPRTRTAAKQESAMREASERLAPLVVETRRSLEQLQRVRTVLARAEWTDAMTFADLLAEVSGRLPRDATALAILPQVPTETALALGNLRRAGLAVSVILVLLDDESLERAHSRLLTEGIRDIRHLRDEADLADICRTSVQRLEPYRMA